MISSFGPNFGFDHLVQGKISKTTLDLGQDLFRWGTIDFDADLLGLGLIIWPETKQPQKLLILSQIFEVEFGDYRASSTKPMQLHHGYLEARFDHQPFSKRLQKIPFSSVIF